MYKYATIFTMILIIWGIHKALRYNMRLHFRVKNDLIIILALHFLRLRELKLKSECPLILIFTATFFDAINGHANDPGNYGGENLGLRIFTVTFCKDLDTYDHECTLLKTYIPPIYSCFTFSPAVSL